MPTEPIDPLTQAVQDARAALDSIDPELAAPHKPTGRPRLDPYKGAKTVLYLRADVVAWLKLEAQARGNGWTPSRVANEALRQMAAADADKAVDEGLDE